MDGDANGSRPRGELHFFPCLSGAWGIGVSYTTAISFARGIAEMNMDMSAAAAALSVFRSGMPTVERPAALRQELAYLLESCFALDGRLADPMQILDFLFDDALKNVPTFALEARDTVFAENLLSLKPYVMSGGKFRSKALFVKRSPQTHDCLADDTNEWSPIRVLNWALMASLPSRQRVAIVTSVRNEGATMIEWLAHHRANGIDGFYVYTNDNTDGSDVLLHTLADYGVISLIENEVGPGVRIQAKILEHSLHLVPELREFEWVFYIDVDEFLIVRCEPELTLNSFFEEFAKAFPTNPPSAVCFNWKWFGSENAFEATEAALLERFVYSIHNEHVKSMVRLRDTISMHRVHAPVLLKGAQLVNSEFKSVDAAITMKPTYQTGQLNHYWNKSFQEFVLKRARGRISKGLDGDPLDFTSFFDWGVNAKRGNFDPPDARVLNRFNLEYRNLLSIPGVGAQLNTIRAARSEMLRILDRELNIAAIYERRGR